MKVPHVKASCDQFQIGKLYLMVRLNGPSSDYIPQIKEWGEDISHALTVAKLTLTHANRNDLSWGT